MPTEQIYVNKQAPPVSLRGSCKQPESTASSDILRYSLLLTGSQNRIWIRLVRFRSKAVISVLYFHVPYFVFSFRQNLLLVCSDYIKA